MPLAVRILGSLAAIAAILWPATAIVLSALTDPMAEAGASGPRLTALFGRALGWSVTAALVAMVVALPVARAIGRSGLSRVGSLSIGLWAVVLLCPTMITTLGWDRVLPVSAPPAFRLLLVWSLWIWPISALVVGGGWFRSARGIEDAARLDGSGGVATYALLFGALGRHLALALLLSVAVLLADYNAPHAAGMTVYATELLGIAANSRNAADVLLAALPSVVCIAVLYASLLAATGRNAARSVDDGPPGAGPPAVSSRAWQVCLVCMSVGLPTLALSAALLRAPGAMSESWTTYRADLAWTLLIAALSGALSVVIGLAFARGRAGGVVLVVALLLGLGPGALTGSAMIAAYNRAAVAFVYDHFPILVLAGTARYAWIAIIGCRLLARRAGGTTNLEEQAQTDGATGRGALIRILLGAHRGSVLGIGLIVGVLVMGEAAAMSLVRVPGFTPISLVMIEKFHRAEDGMLLSLGSWEALIVLTGGVVVSRLIPRD